MSIIISTVNDDNDHAYGDPGKERRKEGRKEGRSEEGSGSVKRSYDRILYINQLLR